MALQSVLSVRDWVLRSSVLSLAKTWLNGVEVRAVRRQVAKYCPRRFDSGLDAGDLVRAQVVHHDDVSSAQLWREELLHPGHKDRAVDRPVQHQRCQQPVLAQCANKRRGVPVATWRIARAALAPG